MLELVEAWFIQGVEAHTCNAKRIVIMTDASNASAPTRAWHDHKALYVFNMLFTVADHWE